MTRLLTALCALFLAIAPALADDKPKAEEKPKSGKKPTVYKIPGYTTATLEGFTLFISDETKEHENDAQYERKPMEVLELELKGIVRVMQPKMLKVLQTIKVFVEWNDPESKPPSGNGVVVARYWYDSGRGYGMLKEGRNPLKANNIEILNMRHLTEKWQPGKSSEQIVLLHEMCHAVHSHILGNENASVKAAYNQAMERGLYSNNKHESGRTMRAYAATNDHEYFAELCCAYLDRCAFFPFTREELKDHDPVGYKLMEYYWTPKDPRSAKAKVAPKTETKLEARTEPKVAAKPDEKPAAKASGAEAEAAAARKLELIDVLIKANRKDKAREKLQEVLDAYPGTDAAKKAKELLDGLK